MPYEELKRSGCVTAGRFEKSEIKELLAASRRDLKSARAVLKVDATMAQDAGYGAMLKAGRALMFSKGLRPRLQGQHATVVLFCRESFKRSEDHLLDTFDRLRRARHEHLYWGRQPATETEARASIRIAAEFVKCGGSLGAIKGKTRIYLQQNGRKLERRVWDAMPATAG